MASATPALPPRQGEHVHPSAIIQFAWVCLRSWIRCRFVSRRAPVSGEPFASTGFCALVIAGVQWVAPKVLLRTGRGGPRCRGRQLPRGGARQHRAGARLARGGPQRARGRPRLTHRGQRVHARPDRDVDRRQAQPRDQPAAASAALPRVRALARLPSRTIPPPPASVGDGGSVVVIAGRWTLKPGTFGAGPVARRGSSASLEPGACASAMGPAGSRVERTAVRLMVPAADETEAGL